MSGTKQYVEQRIMKRRAQEAKDGDLRRKLTENNIIAGHGRSEFRVEGMRRARSEAAERRDLFADYTYVRGEQEQERRRQVAQFEEHLADELSRRKAAQLRDDMDRRRICDGSEELRSLKERLHMAKVNKERAQQLMDQQVRAEGERLLQHKIDEHMEDERLEHQELEHKLSIEKAKQRERVKRINQQQIASQEAAKQAAFEEYLKDRDQVLEVVEKIAAEDAEDLASQRRKKAEAIVAMEKFMVEQKARQEAAERAEADENARIEEFARQKREQEERLAEEKALAEREKARLVGQIVGGMEKETRAKEEFERLRNDLHLEELEAESRRREEMQMRKKLEDMEEMKIAYTHQMKLREQSKAARQEEEERVREQLLKKFAEDDRIEQMNEQRRRLKQEAHKREAQRLVELRRRMYEEARQAERDQDDRLRDDEARRHVVIEEERRRLLREHAAELIDFLPKGTLETVDDYALLKGR